MDIFRKVGSMTDTVNEGWIELNLTNSWRQIEVSTDTNSLGHNEPDTNSKTRICTKSWGRIEVSTDTNSLRQNEPVTNSKIRICVKSLRQNENTNSYVCSELKSGDYVKGCDEHIIWSFSRKVRNKFVKVTNGNRSDKSNFLKIINWNLGPCLWINKTDDICHMTTDIRPDIAIISEVNLQYTEDLHLIDIPGYKINTTKDYLAHDLSILVVLTKENLNYQILNDRMSENISTIWLKFPRKGKKPFM